jgi:pilus assembly protein CpaE
MPEMDGIEVLKRLRSNSETSNIPIIMFTAKSQVEDKVTGFESGADDYLTKPTHPAELTARVRTLLARSAGKKAAAPVAMPTRNRGNVVCVIGARGGLGVSTIAANIALALQDVDGAAVALADFVPGSGSQGLMFGLKEQDDLIALLRKDAPAISEVDLQNALVKHESGLNVLPATYQSGDGRYRSAGDQMTAIVDRLSYMFDQVVVDLGSGLNPGSEKVLEKTDSVLVVIDPVMATITQTRALLEELRMKVLGLGAIKIVLVNRVKLAQQLTPREIQKQLGHSVTSEIAPMPDLAYQALGQGTPISLLSPDEKITDQFKKIAEAVAVSGA